MIDLCLRCRCMLNPDEDVWAGLNKRVAPRESERDGRLPVCPCPKPVARRIGFNPVSWKLTVAA